MTDVGRRRRAAPSTATGRRRRPTPAVAERRRRRGARRHPGPAPGRPLPPAGRHPARAASSALGVVGVVVLLARRVGRRRRGHGQPTPAARRPAATWGAGVELLARRRPARTDLAASLRRVAIGYAISMAIGVVLGVLDRQLPLGRGVPRAADRLPALHPGQRAHARCSCCGSGIDEAPKIALIVVGTVFYNILMIADVARAVPQELINAAVHARRRPPHRAAPGDPAPLLPGHHRRGPHQPGRAWLMLVVAELLAAQEGLAFRSCGPSASARSTACSPCSSSSGSSAWSATWRSAQLRKRTAPWSRGRDDERRRRVPELVGRRRRPRSFAGRRRRRRRRRPRRHRPARRAGRAGVHRRRVGLREVDAAQHRRRARDRHAPARCGSTATSSSGPGPTAGMVFQALLAVPVEVGGREHRLRPRVRRLGQGPASGAGRRAARDHGPHRVRRPPARPALRAACASGWPSPGPWPPSPTCCCSTSRSAPSTPRPSGRCRTSCCTVRQRTGATILMVTHDVAEAVYLSQRIYVLSLAPGPGGRGDRGALRRRTGARTSSATPASSTSATRSRTSCTRPARPEPRRREELQATWRTVRMPWRACMSAIARLASARGRRPVIIPSRSRRPAFQSASSRGISRWESQLPSRQPISFFSVAVKPTTPGMVMPWSIGGAPTQTVVPPARLAAMPRLDQGGLAGGLEAVVHADAAGELEARRSATSASPRGRGRGWRRSAGRPRAARPTGRTRRSWRRRRCGRPG